MKIYMVENREKCTVDPSKMEEYLEILCSTEEKAREYCVKDAYAALLTGGIWWWYVIRAYMLDDDDYQEVIAFYDWNGKEIDKQPLDGY